VTTPYEYVTREDEKALVRESKAGLPPVLVTESGLETPQDSRYLLVAGERAPGSVLTGLILWDPTSQDVVLAVPQGKRVLVRQGPAPIVGEMLEKKTREREILAAAVESIGNAYDEGRFVLSNWLLEIATAGLRTLLDHYGEDVIEIDYQKTYPPRQAAIWKDLRARGVDPWRGRRKR
jgi:hypothetical protein